MKLSFRSTPLLLISLCAGLLLSACGGGEEERTAIPMTAFSAESQAQLQGEWPTGTGMQYYWVSDQQYWNQLWSERKASLNCAAAFNQAACNASSTPPVVDFSKFMIIGIYGGRQFQFTGQPDHIQAWRDSSGPKVLFRSAPWTKAADSAPEAAFFLIPATKESVMIGPLLDS
jgi:hypothetical protein